MGNADWTREPDLELLRRAHGLLESDSKQALMDLKALADRGSLMSMLYIANAYSKGKGTAVDMQQAESWYRRAMNAGSVLGSYELGRIHYERKDYSKAEESFNVGAGQNYAPSLHMLGLMFLSGAGVKKDLSKAKQLLENATALGHVFAKRNLGSLLMAGSYAYVSV